MNFKQGDIITAEILFSNQVGAKVRPALVISNDYYNSNSDDIIVLKVTSKGKDYPYDILLTQSNLTNGKLKQESVIQADFPVVIDKSAAKQKIAKANKKILIEVKLKMKKLFEI